MKGFRSLIVWQKSHQLALDVFHSTKYFPTAEQYNLTSQFRRASLSIPTHIAEGSGRKSQKENAHSLSIAMGSAHEVQYLLLFSKDYHLIENNIYDRLNSVLEEIKSMLYVLVNKIKT